MIAILDYGSGNLRSALRAFETTGRKVFITSDAEQAEKADALVVPGVGAKPGKLSNRHRFYWLLATLISWLVFTPWLHHIGAAAYKTDALIFLGSVVAQIVMVYEKYENWPIWLAVDGLATIEYAVLKYWSTALLYLLFTGIAVVGWVKWLRIHKSSLDRKSVV